MPFTSPKSEPKDDPKSSLKTFLQVCLHSYTAQLPLMKISQQSPTTQYTFDSERGSDHSEICRNTKDGKKECADIWLNSMQMFAAMQVCTAVCPEQARMFNMVYLAG